MMGKRGPTCRVCAHRERAAIDLALARGVSITAMARRYKVSTDTLYRHSANHLPPQLRAKLIAGPSLEGVDLDALKETESQSLLVHLIALRNRLFGSLDTAETYGDAAMVSRVSAQLHHNLEITGKLLGTLATGNSTTNVLILPAYVEMRVELVKALAPFPEARQAVAAVLHKIEHKSADQVKAEADRGLAA